jgi:DNA-binding GntR family transcriptional regulator
VTCWTDKDLDELFSVRALLEAYGAAQAAERATDAQVDTMSKLCDRMDALAEQAIAGAAAQDGQTEEVYHQIAELNNEFHEAVLAAAGNAHLQSLMGGLISMPLVQRTFMRYSPHRLSRSMSHHRELVDAIRAHDGNWASSVMNAHVRSARVELY